MGLEASSGSCSKLSIGLAVATDLCRSQNKSKLQGVGKFVMCGYTVMLLIRYERDVTVLNQPALWKCVQETAMLDLGGDSKRASDKSVRQQNAHLAGNAHLENGTMAPSSPNKCGVRPMTTLLTGAAHP